MFKPFVSAAVVSAIAITACSTATVSTPRLTQPLAPFEIAALVELMRFEDTRSFDAAAFASLATSKSELIRARTMLAAGRIGNRDAVDLLIGGLADPGDTVKVYAAFGLGELGDSSARVAQALGPLTIGRGAAAREAVAALGKIGGSTARPLVEHVIRQHRSGLELQEALLALWRFPRTPETSTLGRPHTSSGDPEVRWRATYALTRGGPDPANVTLFQRLARDAHPMVRQLALRGLRAATVDSAALRPASAEILLSALADPHDQVRITAAGMLGGYRDSTHAGRVALLLADPQPNVRVAAAQALALIKGPAAASALAARVNDVTERTAIRGSSLVSLAAIAPAHALTLAAPLVRSPEPVLRVYVARALANVRLNESLEMLRTLSNDADVRVQASAVSAVVAVAGDTLQSARAFFMEKLAARPPYVRAAALSGLQRLAQPGDEAVILEAFAFALRDSTEDAAVAALAVLGRLARDNPAITRSFSARFPFNRIPLQDVQRAAIRELKLTEQCCMLTARPAVYERVVREVLVPALETGSRPRARITTAGGSFDIELLSADAPLTVDNFVTLVRQAYFNNGSWHRVVPNFVLQDGDPTGTGSGGPGYSIRDEINRVRYLRGIMGMALSGPDTGGSQWFITHSPQPHLDGGYTVFGRVISGMEVADRVIQDDPITSIEIVR
ncbi:MAG: peptidylprolyl isomerase [Gemmatimonadota bacterium]